MALPPPPASTASLKFMASAKNGGTPEGAAPPEAALPAPGQEHLAVAVWAGQEKGRGGGG